jgi:RNA polymerase-binding transcription factor DksA
MDEYQDIRASLQHKLEQLQHRLGKIDHNLRRTPDRDSQEQAQERENDEVLERLDQSGRDELNLLRTALERMDTGSYGVCIQCGKSIPVRRLEVLPYTLTCMKCAQ